MATSVTKSFVEHPDTPASVLITICVDAWGMESLYFESDTIKDSFKAQGMDIHEFNLDKIQAAQTVLTSDLFFTDLGTYRLVIDALSGEGVNFETLDIPLPEEIAAALAEVIMLEPPEKPLEELFSDDIKVFTRTLLDDYGLVQTPRVLAWCGEGKQPHDGLLNDEAIFAAHNEDQKQSVDNINDAVQDRLVTTLKAIHVLPLHTRDKVSWNSLKRKYPEIFPEAKKKETKF